VTAGPHRSACEAEHCDRGSQLLASEQDFRCYGRSGSGDGVHDLQAIPQRFPEDIEEGLGMTEPSESKS
jgi:hypothetical protein